MGSSLVPGRAVGAHRHARRPPTALRLGRGSDGLSTASAHYAGHDARAPARPLVRGARAGRLRWASGRCSPTSRARRSCSRASMADSSPQLYSVLFAIYGVGLIAASQVYARLVGRFVAARPPRGGPLCIAVLLGHAAGRRAGRRARCRSRCPSRCSCSRPACYPRCPTRWRSRSPTTPRSPGPPRRCSASLQFLIGARVVLLVGACGTRSAVPMAAVITTPPGCARHPPRRRGRASQEPRVTLDPAGRGHPTPLRQGHCSRKLPLPESSSASASYPPRSRPVAAAG